MTSANADAKAGGKGRLSRNLKIGGMAVVALVVLIIVLQNTEAVQTDILFLKITMPRAVLLFGTLVIGFVLGILASFRRR
jgi:uncharacterized integral membrane protein